MTTADYFRVVVLIQVAVVTFIVLRALLVSMRPFRKAPRNLRVILLGRLAGAAGALATCVLIVYDIAHRFGFPHLDPRTPLAQIAMLCWLVAFAYSDRPRIKTVTADEALDDLIHSVQKRP